VQARQTGILRGIGSTIFAILEKVERLKILKTVIAASIGLAGFSGALANELINSPAYSPIAQATKNGTRFVADISSTDGNDIDQPTGGFIDSIYLHVELDRLIGQPTEFYGLKWMRGDRVDIPLSSGKVISQFALSQLDKYPDLKARFADLRPVDLKLSYKFGLGFNDSMNGLVNQTQGLQTPHFYTAQNHADGKKVISRSPHLIIMGSGQQGTDFIPSSPRDWASFANWEYGLATKAGQNTNLAAQNTFEQATQMWLSELTVESIELPVSQMSAIYEEFQRREQAKEEEEKAEAEAKRAEQIEKSAEAKLAAKMKQIEAQKAAEAKRQKELALQQSAEAKLAAKMREMAKTDARTSADQQTPDNSVAKKGTFSPKAVPSAAGLIRLDPDKGMGVINANGAVLIPFGPWDVQSYSDGKARMFQFLLQKFFQKNEKRCSEIKLVLTEFFWKSGMMDINGNWSDDTEIFGRVAYAGAGQDHLPEGYYPGCKEAIANLNSRLSARGIRIASFAEMAANTERQRKLRNNTPKVTVK
jgi:hypothetical protein